MNVIPPSRPGQPGVAEFRVSDWNMPWAFEAIGRLVSGYVNVEQLISNLFGTLSGLPWPDSTLLQGDGRPSTYMATIKRLARFRRLGEDYVKHLELVFQEINYIKEIRDVVCHCGVDYVSPTIPWMRFNNHFTSGIDKQRTYILSGQDLYDCAFYLFELARHLGALTDRKLPEPTTLQGRPQLLEILHPRSQSSARKQKRRREPHSE